MVHEAFRSLMKDRTRSFFCWLTYFLSALYIFLFFTISLSTTVGVTLFDSNTTSMTYLMIFGILICALEIFFANDFYVRNKAKELAVMSVCGASLKQLGVFLLLQTVLLFLTALPAGILTGTALMPLINRISSGIGVQEAIRLNLTAVRSTAVILGSIIFWMTFVNLAFVYRSSSASLLNVQSLTAPKEKLFMLSHKPDTRLRNLVSLALFVLPFIGFFADPGALPLFASISLYGLIRSLDQILMPLLERRIHEKTADPISFITLGFIRRDMKVLRVNLILLIVTLTVLTSMLAGHAHSGQTVLILITLAAMDLLLSLALLFRFTTELSGRRKAFHTLQALGCLTEQIRRIRHREIFTCYGILLLILLVYTGALSGSLVMAGTLSVPAFVWIVSASAAPLPVCALLNVRWYAELT